MTATKSKDGRKPKTKAYPKGLSMSIQKWADSTFKSLENSFVNRIDCATAFALTQLSNGSDLDFVAFRYKLDDKDALAIVTESMKIEGMSLGMWSYVKFTNISDFCQTLVHHGHKLGIEVIALRVGDNERVYLEPLSLEQKLIWTQDPKATIDNHRRWRADKILNEWSAKINVEYTMKNKVPGQDVLLEFFDEWSQYADVNISRIREQLMSLKRKDIKSMLGEYSFGLQRMILHMSFDSWGELVKEDTNNG
jgi:hypothetical protein